MVKEHFQNNWMVTTSHIGMPVLACKDDNNEWCNIKNGKDNELEYICYSCIATYYCSFCAMVGYTCYQERQEEIQARRDARNEN